VAGCLSNDLFREAVTAGIALERVRITVTGDYAGDPPVATPIEYEVEIRGDASAEALAELVRKVDAIAEIPNSLRGGTEVRLRGVHAG